MFDGFTLERVDVGEAVLGSATAGPGRPCCCCTATPRTRRVVQAADHPAMSPAPSGPSG